MNLVADAAWPMEDDRMVESIGIRAPGVRVRRGGLHRGTWTVPSHAVALVHPIVTRAGWRFTWRRQELVDDLGRFPDLTDLGTRVLTRLENEKILRPGVADTFYDYQREAFGFACFESEPHLWLPCGGGKTRVSLAWLRSVPGACVFVTRVALTTKVQREYEALFNGLAHVWRPPSRRKKGYIDTATYLDLVASAGETPFLVVGQENLVDAIDDLGKAAITSIAFDEIHRLASWKRWEASMRVDDDEGAAPASKGFSVASRGGVGVDFSLKENIAAAAYELSRRAKRRIGLTATPVPDRIRNLWAPLDLIGPRNWGKFYDFAARYCAARPGSFGGIDTTGASNIEELQNRLEWVAWNVPLSRVQESLPPFKEDVVWLTADNLTEPLGGWQRELKRAGREGGESLLEAHLAMTASRKRRWVVGQVVDALKCGMKVLVFSGRRRDVDEITATIRQNAEADWHVDGCHGGSEDLQAHVDGYMGAVGAAVLVATYDSIGDGQDLQDTDLCLATMLPPSPVKVTQMKGRVSRPGQKRPVLFRWCVAQGTYDERVLAILAPKLGVVSGLMGDEAATTTGAVLRSVDDQGALLEELAAIVAGAGSWEVHDEED